MPIVTDWEFIDTSYGPMRMFTARPEGGTAGPGVLIVHDASAADAWTRTVDVLYQHLEG